MDNVEIQKIVSEVLEISDSINDKKAELDTLYIQLGKAYYNEHQDHAEDTFSQYTDQIKSVNENIVQLQEKLEKLIADKACVTDKSEMDTCINAEAEIKIEETEFDLAEETAESTVSQIVNESTQRVCKKCGSVAEVDMCFCVECGSKLDEEAESEKIKADEIVCPKCGKHSASEMRFCTDCGAKLFEEIIQTANKCPRCSTEITKGMTFCVECGYRVDRDNSKDVQNPYAVSSEKVCPRCGRTQSIGMKFCVDCGTKL